MHHAQPQKVMTPTAVVVKAIVETYRITTSFEDKVNRFLDKLLALKQEYAKLNKEWENVNELTEKYVSECHSNEELTMLLLSIEGLIKSGESLHHNISQNILKVLPSVLTDIENNLDHIKEIQADIKIKISDLPDLIAEEENLVRLGF